MNRAVAALLLSGLLLSSPTFGQEMVPTEVGDLVPSPGGTITFGDAVTDGDYAPTVRLVFTKGLLAHVCTGTLIAPNLIVTALHCGFDENGTMLQSFDFSLRAVGSSPEYRRSQKASKESTYFYNDATYTYKNKSGEEKIGFKEGKDILLLRLDDNVPDAEKRTAEIFTKGNEALFPVATLVGWGRTENNTLPGVLQKIDVNNTSQLNLTSLSIPTQIDVKNADGSLSSAGVCGGDSGGPLYVARTTAVRKSALLLGVIYAYLPPEPRPDNWEDLSESERCTLEGTHSLAVNLLMQDSFLTDGQKYLGVGK